MTNFLQEGEFSTGCNYWASHAGTAMWKNWQPEVVEKDFKILSDAGLTVLRVFPLWPDFQPITPHYDAEGLIQVRHGENSFTHEEYALAGIDETMIQRFSYLVKTAEKYGFQLVVSLINGWMSGRLFIPPALYNKNILTDPDSLMWQTRFVKTFVQTFCNEPAIVGWDLGNECNVMEKIDERSKSWLWTSAISNAIRSIDPKKPVISGMHGLTLDGVWRIQDQGELTDILTTHPYPLFTPYCDQEPANTMRPLLHATVESIFYNNISGKKCFAEEMGTLGPMVAGEKTTAEFLRTNLYSLWAHDCRALLWWCAFDQDHLDSTPYQWKAIERELGLVKNNGTPKPLVFEIKEFNNFLKNNINLPARSTDAVCILSKDQDHWAVAFSAFVLAKQAGLEIEFQYHDQPLKPALAYLLPCITGTDVIWKDNMSELLKRVKEGATLYISYDGGFLSSFNDICSVEVHSKEKRTEPVSIHLKMADTNGTWQGEALHKLNIESTSARVIAAEEDGNPVFTETSCGKGSVYFLGVPLEKACANQPFIFNNETSVHNFYRIWLKNILLEKLITINEPYIGVTEHRKDENFVWIVCINYSNKKIQTPMMIKNGWKITKTYTSDNNNRNYDDKFLILDEFQTTVLSLEKTGN